MGGGRFGGRAEAMGREPIWRLMARFAIPPIVSMVALASYNLVDAYFVGRLGTAQLAALAVAFPVMLIFMSVMMGSGIGAASLVSRNLGAGNREGASRAAGTAITVSILLGALVTLICLPSLNFLVELFGARGDVVAPARIYLGILVAFAVVESFPTVINNIIRAEGNAGLSGAVMIVSALANIPLDIILIFGLGPIPALGVAGAAWATVIARGIGLVIYLGYFLAGKSSYQFRSGYFIPRMKIITEIYRTGTASIARQIAMSLILLLANRVAVSFGNITLSVLAVVFRIGRFAFQPSMGLGQGILPLIGYNFGANKKERVGEIVMKAGLASLIWGLLLWSLFMLFSRQIISAFNTDPQFVAEGSRALRIFVLFFFAVGLQMMASFFFQGIGKGMASLVMATSRQVILLVPALLVMPRLFGVTGLWAAFATADLMSVILTLVWTVIEFRRQGIQFSLGQPGLAPADRRTAKG